MPGLECEKLTYYDYIEDISDLFGFFYCKIEAPTSLYLGLLPLRFKLGIVFPVGTWEGCYFSEELKFAKENGYVITVIKGYTFNKVKDVFNSYVEAIYNIKSNPTNQTQKVLAKSLLNNLLGRFGINLDKAITDVMSQEEFSRRSIMNKIVSYKVISWDKLLVTYIPKLDYDVIKDHELDFIKVSSKYNDVELQHMANTSIIISAAVTAYARIHITKLKLYILSRGGQIFYSDTDSIVTDIKLDNTMVDAKELGKLKLEHLVSKGIFITNKTYCIIDSNNKFINKAKGIKNTSLVYDDYLSLLNNVAVKGVKRYSKTDWEKGDVIIYDNDNITINSNSYTKRTKILANNIWVDKLLVINNYIKPINGVSVLNKNWSILGVKSSIFSRSYTTYSRLDKVNNKILIRAVGNFLKGVLNVGFEGVIFKDYTILSNFILNFYKNIKITAQSLSNIN